MKGVKDYLLTIEGLPSARIDDLIVDENDNMALVTSLNYSGLKALALDPIKANPGMRFYLKGKEEIFSFGEHLFGRVIDGLGRPVDGKGAFPKPQTEFLLDVTAPRVNSRRQVDEQFVTGITAIDTLFPLGKGQRQMLFGPIKSGKTALLADLVRNQRGTDTICIYAAVGKPVDFLDSLVPSLFGEGGHEKTIIMSSLSNSPSPLIYITPAIALLLAEHFQSQGKDVFLVLDDMGAHAKYLREISLLKEVLPGRESYPGDLFYRQAHIIERGGRFNDNAGGGSITIFPTLKTDIESYSDLLSTNLIATTDGHISSSSLLYRQGVYPPIVTEESVTRIGRNTQTLAQKQLSVKIISILAEYKKQQEYTRFGTQVSDRMKKILHQGELIKEMLSQKEEERIEPTIQVMFLTLVFTEFLADKEVEFLQRNRDIIIRAIKERGEFEEMKEMVRRGAELDEFIESMNKKTSVLEEICQ